MGDVLCSGGINRQLALAFQFKNNPSGKPGKPACFQKEIIPWTRAAGINMVNETLRFP
jgi:hypothetical protein